MELVGFEEFEGHIQQLLWPGFAEQLLEQLEMDLAAFASELPGSPTIERVELTQRCIFDLRCKKIPDRPESIVQPVSLDCPFVLSLQTSSSAPGLTFLTVRMTYKLFDMDTDHLRYEVECELLDTPVC